jgi:hypothetical protein
MTNRLVALTAFVFSLLLSNPLASATQQSDSENAAASWRFEIGAINGDGETTSEAKSDDAVTRNGTPSLRLSGDSSTVRWLSATRTVKDVRPGQRYRLAAWIATRNVRQEGRQYFNCNVYAQFKSQEGEVIRSANGFPVIGTRPLLGTNNWTRVEATVRVPPETSTALVGCFLSCSGTAWFDDVTFTPLPVPDWKTEDTGRYIYHWEHEGTPPRIIVSANETFLEDLELLLDTHLPEPVQYFLYEDNARKGEVTGNAGNAHVEESHEIHTLFWTDRHEVVHLLTRQWPGEGTALLGEGLAVHLSGSWQAEPVDVAVRNIQSEGPLIPLSELISTTSFRAHEDQLSYPQAGSFVQFLFETYGLAAFRQLYTTTPLNPDAPTFDKLLEHIYKKNLAQLEAQWLETIEAGTAKDSSPP